MKKLSLGSRSAQRCSEDRGFYPKLTARAQVAMTLAHQEALRRGDDYIGTEHLLIGLLGEEEGIAATVLGGCGITMDSTRAAVDDLVGRRADAPTAKRALPLMPRVKRVMEFAEQESERLRQRYVGTEHLLLGILREGEGVAADILLRRGVSFERAWADILARLASVGQPTAPAAEQGGSTAVMCRLDAGTLAAVDALIEAGVRGTRSDAVAWLVQAGIEANTPLLATVQETVAEIRRLRAHAQTLAQRAIAGDGATSPDERA